MHNNGLLQNGESTNATTRCQNNAAQRILVVEDDTLVRQVNVEVLIRAGYQVDYAEDGAAAWDSLQLNRYDLLVTDNSMPKMSGVELLHQLHGIGMALPVIMATGTLPIDEFTRNPWLQPAATLLKPFTGKELLATVERVLLRAPGTVLNEIAFLPFWGSRPSADGLLM